MAMAAQKLGGGGWIGRLATLHEGVARRGLRPRDGRTGSTSVDDQCPMNTYRNGGTDHDLIHARGQAPR